MRFTTMLVGLTLSFLCSAYSQSQSDGDEFLSAAKHNLIGNFLAPEVADIASEDLDSFICRIESSWNVLDSEKRLKEQKNHFVVEGSLSSKGIVQKSWGTENGRQVMENEKTLSSFWCQRWKAGTRAAVNVRNQLWDLMHFEKIGKEILGGRECLLYSFSVEKRAANFPELKRCADTKGRVWFDEEEKVLVKVEGTYRTEISLVGGILTARSIPKGTQWNWRFEKVSGSWVPMHWEELRPELEHFRKIWSQTISTYSNYRRINQDARLFNR